jgi:hypothetical protein
MPPEALAGVSGAFSHREAADAAHTYATPILLASGTLALTIDQRRPADSRIWAARNFQAHRPFSVNPSPTKPRYGARR